MSQRSNNNTPSASNEDNATDNNSNSQQFDNDGDNNGFEIVSFLAIWNVVVVAGWQFFVNDGSLPAGTTARCLLLSDKNSQPFVHTTFPEHIGN
ncbi:hypothetical protein Trydic_g8198 [Trypoxylus dichotomus]